MTPKLTSEETLNMFGASSATSTAQTTIDRTNERPGPWSGHGPGVSVEYIVRQHGRADIIDFVNSTQTDQFRNPEIEFGTII